MGEYYIYIISCAYYLDKLIVKIGHTGGPKERIQTYLVGCPPEMEPSSDLYFCKLWLTTAITEEESKHFEGLIHNKFFRNRMMRHILGDTEWFKFDEDPIATISSYMNTRPWVVKEAPYEDIGWKRRNKVFSKNYQRNLSICTDTRTLHSKREELQKPIIDNVCKFFSCKVCGCLILPCGFGKTVITCKCIKTMGLRRVIVACLGPVQMHWTNEMIKTCAFDKDDIHIVGRRGTTDSTAISKILAREKYCVITTYNSSHLLIDHMKSAEMMIVDEAHHMAGVVAQEDDGVGKTRRMMVSASRLNIKRLSLTFTPRIVKCTDEGIDYISMDHYEIFGDTIAKMTLRELINKGVQPDYRIWLMENETERVRSTLSICEMISNAWDAKEVTSGNAKNVINKLVVFAPTIEEADEIYETLKTRLSDTKILRVKAGDDVQSAIEKFTLATRAIIVNCKVLGEGVDVPCADSVCITYPKKSREQMIQMLLRAGRWYSGKLLFHILIPKFNHNDMDGYMDVLMSLASVDSVLESELKVKLTTVRVVSGGTHTTTEKPEYDDEICEIIIEKFGSTEEEVKKCFEYVAKRGFFGAGFLDITYEKVRKILKEKNIITKEAYIGLCEKDSRLPLEPDIVFKSQFTGWVDFLNIQRGSYYELATCKRKVADYLSQHSGLKEDYLDLAKVCHELCNIDPQFPPDGLWVDYYKVKDLRDIMTIDTRRKGKYDAFDAL